MVTKAEFLNAEKAIMQEAESIPFERGTQPMSDLNIPVPTAGGLPIGGVGSPGLSAIELVKISGLMSVFGALIAGLTSIPKSIIGKEINVAASELNLDMANLRLQAQEALYTIPNQDPKTGEWTFLDSDGDRLFRRMQEAGVARDAAELRMIQKNQEREANAKLIAAAGPIRNLDVRPGELPFQAAKRTVEEKRESKEKIAGQRTEIQGKIATLKGQTSVPDVTMAQQAAQIQGRQFRQGAGGGAFGSFQGLSPEEQAEQKRLRFNIEATDELEMLRRQKEGLVRQEEIKTLKESLPAPTLFGKEIPKEMLLEEGKPLPDVPPQFKGITVQDIERSIRKALGDEQKRKQLVEQMKRKQRIRSDAQ